MTDNLSADPAPTPGAAGAQSEASLRILAMIGYGLFLVAPLNGLTALIGVILAYVKRRDAEGTLWRSHFENLIVVFWITIAAAAVGMMSFPLALGILLSNHFAWPVLSWFTIPFVIFPLLAIWILYRLIRGLVHASESGPY